MSKPFSEWTIAEMKENSALVGECRMTWGIQAARELMEKLGFPIPPPELIMPVEELEKLLADEDDD